MRKRKGIRRIDGRGDKIRGGREEEERRRGEEKKREGVEEEYNIIYNSIV